VLLAQRRTATGGLDLQRLLRNFGPVDSRHLGSAPARRESGLRFVFDAVQRDGGQGPAELLGEEHILTTCGIGKLSAPHGVGWAPELVRSKDHLQASDITSIPVAQHAPLRPSEASRAEHTAHGAPSENRS
jgi:hypothetical protein